MKMIKTKTYELYNSYKPIAYSLYYGVLKNAVFALETRLGTPGYLYGWSRRYNHVINCHSPVSSSIGFISYYVSYHIVVLVVK